jgi:hypothetical protein
MKGVEGERRRSARSSPLPQSLALYAAVSRALFGLMMMMEPAPGFYKGHALKKYQECCEIKSRTSLMIC